MKNRPGMTESDTPRVEPSARTSEHDREDRQRLERHSAYQSPELECDVVMKGGITSGVVYPLAVCELATAYRLRNVGGTSAGAIAAAAAAAAEVGRSSAAGGFHRLATLPDFLGRDSHLFDLFQPNSATRPLFGLLKASLGAKGGRALRLTRLVGALLANALRFPLGWALVVAGALPGVGLMAALIGHLDPSETWRPLTLALPLLLVMTPLLLSASACLWRLASGFEMKSLGLLAAALGSAVLLVALTRLVEQQRLLWGLLFAWLVLLLGLFTGALVALTRRALHVLPANGYGLCSGAPATQSRRPRAATTSGAHRRPPGPDHPLTHWLAEELDALADKGDPSQPLTFGDLERSGIRLEMLTTNLTHGRPYRLPLEAAAAFFAPSYFFDPTELRRLFPERIVAWMEIHPPAVRPNSSNRDQQDWEFLCRWLEPLRPLPDAENLPVVVATRMSLSFPVLLAAVPLWAVDWSRRDNIEAARAWRSWRKANPDGYRELMSDPQRLKSDGPGERLTAQVCWFSDGGICSNFPVHFFDSPLPTRPTVALNLRPEHPDYPLTDEQQQNVWLPQENVGGQHLLWLGIHGLGDFVGAILSTMQNWSDNAQMRVHGFWDRIAHIILGEHEGGMNLNMPGDRIRDLGERGRFAGRALAERFSVPTAADAQVSWLSHRWLRYRSTMDVLERYLDELLGGYETEPPAGEPTYQELISRSDAEPPASYRWRRRAQQEFAAGETARLLELIRSWRRSEERFAEGAPGPSPELRVSPSR